ncbi:hypothetical protein AVEN_74014-1 [Araneus ventricosus]|uniref:Uncharacterized protein n=1 Tax=Araneus ventricosus TaxID=182803 RepID=A0A4Y2X2G2_ARAVE|nr:hypothetical protein AVEN_43968-1 [Araneus ventricosus]GBO43731.1 hypothetical protein AVEN_74014-1 [Araneus ventricosus]
MRTVSMKAREGQRTQNRETISANSEFIELLPESEKSSETLKDLENFEQSCSNSSKLITSSGFRVNITLVEVRNHLHHHDQTSLKAK